MDSPEHRCFFCVEIRHMAPTDDRRQKELNELWRVFKLHTDQYWCRKNDRQIRSFCANSSEAAGFRALGFLWREYAPMLNWVELKKEICGDGPQLRPVEWFYGIE